MRCCPYETWLSLGNSGTESDFIASLKGERGEQGLQGLRGEKGSDGIDGFSPKIEAFEDTETSYRLLITNKTNTFETPNLKGSNGISDGEISALQNQISNLNDLISSIQRGGGSLKITTLFDCSSHEKYKNSWNFRCSQLDDRTFSFDETSAKNTAFCNAENGYAMRLSNSFGWSADVSALFLDNIQLNDKLVLIVDYNCTSDGDGMTAEIVSTHDFTSEKLNEFETIPAFYATNTYLSSNFRPMSIFENGNYYLRFRVNTTNPMFTIRKILVVSG